MCFNNTVRLITYEPKGKDTLSKLVRGELTAAEARGIVDPNYSTGTTTPVPITPSIPETQNDQVTDTEPQESPTSKTESKELENPKKAGGFFNRRRPSATRPPSLPPTLPEVIETPALENKPEQQPLKTPPIETTPEVEPAPLAESKPEFEQ
jgi:hypothetical protein